jgi:hypothetical protein
MLTRHLGRKKADPRKARASLSMELALVSANLPPLPSSTDWRSKLSGPLGPMLNDQEGCCTASAQGHTWQLLSATAGPVEITVPDLAVQTAYVGVTTAEGAAANPHYPGFNPSAILVNGENPTDTGCQLGDMIDWVIANGLGGYDFAGAKLSLNPKNFASFQYALWLFGNLQLGVSLTPEALQNTSGVWDIPAHPGFFKRKQYIPDPELGHAVAAFDFNADGSLILGSWGGEYLATPSWLSGCVDEALVILPKNWKTSGNLAPNMIDNNLLASYYPAIVNA